MNTILICDDDKDIVSALDIYLTSEGYATVKAYDGLECRRLAEREPVDLILLDVKHYTPEGYKAITGQSMDAYAEFLETVQSMEIPLWIRHVVVPGLTDGEDHLAGLAEYIKGIRNVKRVELLPYHVLGVPKYHAMGIPYPLEGVPPMDAGETAGWQEIMGRSLEDR